MFNIIKGISSALGYPDQKNSESDKPSELIHFPTGRLNLIRPSRNTKIPKECIYLEAYLSIQRTNIPFNYQLAVGRVEEDTSSENEDLEKVFLLSDKLNFRVYDTLDEISDDEESTTIAFSWIDVSSPELSERFEFVFNIQHPDCPKDNINQATDIIYQCIWEAVNEKDSSEAPEEELLALRHDSAEEIALLEQNSTHLQPDIYYPSQPSEAPRPHSRQSEDSETEGSLQDTSGLGATVDEYDSEEDQSDSSVADEIVNQLKGTNLADKIASPSSIPSPSQASPVVTKQTDHSVYAQKPVSTPFKKVQIVDPESEQSPVRQSLHSPISQVTTPSTPTNHQSQSQTENTPEGSYEEESVTGDVPDSPSPTPDVEEQGQEATTIDVSLPVTDAENEPSTDEARSSWRSTCHLYVFDRERSVFKLFRAKIIAELLVSKPDNPDHEICWLRVMDPSMYNVRLVSTNICEENNLVFNNDAIFFNETSSEQSSYTWGLKFPEGDDMRDQLVIAQEAFAKALYERDNGIGTYDIQDNASKDWDRIRYGVINDGSRVEEDDKEYDEEEEEEESEEEVAISDDEEEDAQLSRFRAKQTGPKNSQLAVGTKEDASFVVRGNMMGIFKNEQTMSNKLKFMTTIPDICTPDGKRQLIPSKIMLHDQDTTVVLQDPSNPNSLYNLDLGVGKVVEEWKINKEGSIRDFCPRTKFSQMNPEATFLGTSADSFYTIDPRVSGYKAILNQSKSYKTKKDFSCAATTESGQIAIGSNTGEIRLFDSQIGKIAKTALPAMKDRIIDIDVCKDGTYLVATCEKFLLLVNCQLPDSNVLGFQKSFPKDQKPNGMRIELTREHRAQLHEEKIPFRFKPAKYNQGRDAVEKTIVTSIGPYIIAYDFKKLKMGQTDYTLKQYEENIVADSFRWDNDKDIVVTMPSSVFMEKRKKLSKPVRDSLVLINTPFQSGRPSTSAIRSGSSSLGVVQEWDG